MHGAMMSSRFVPALIALGLITGAHAAPSPLQEKVRAWRVAHEREMSDEYR